MPSALLPRRAAHYRHGPLRDLTFKTFAWLITREAFDAMRREVPSMLAMPGDARVWARQPDRGSVPRSK